MVFGLGGFGSRAPCLSAWVIELPEWPWLSRSLRRGELARKKAPYEAPEIYATMGGKSIIHHFGCLATESR